MSDEYFDYLDRAHTPALHAPSPITPPPQNVERPKIQPADLCAGCIVWLPAMNDLNGGIKCCCARCPVSEDLDEGGYNHPVVVLKIRQATNSTVRGDLVCEVACTTSFSSMSLDTYQNKRRKVPHLNNSIPIMHPKSEAYPGKQLKLEKEKKLHKQSYVRLKHVYQIEAAKLRGFVKRAYKRRLDESSYEELMGKLRLAKDKWVDTNTLWETKDQRLLELANSNSRTRQTSRHQPAETIAGSQPPRTSETVGYYSQQPYWLTSSTNPQSRQNSNTSAPITPQPSRVYLSHLPDHVNPNRTTRVPPVTPQQQARAYYNPPTWPNAANTTHTPQRNYGTVHPSSRPDRYVQSRSSYVPPRPDPEGESSSWLFVKCLAGFIAVGALFWWWDAKK